MFILIFVVLNEVLAMCHVKIGTKVKSHHDFTHPSPPPSEPKVPRDIFLVYRVIIFMRIIERLYIYLSMKKDCLLDTSSRY